MRLDNLRIIDRLMGIKYIHLLWMSVLASEIFTAIIVSVMSMLFYGRILPDYLITGAVAAFLVSLIVCAILLLISSHLKIKEEELRSSNELFENIFSNVHMLIAYMDPKFNFIRVNEAYAKAAGHPVDFFVGKNHFDLYPYKDNEAIFSRVVETGIPYIAHAKPFEYAEHPEWGVSYWDWTLMPLKDGRGKVTSLLFTLLDVTERIKAENELRVINITLEKRIQKEIEKVKEQEQMMVQQSRLASMGEMLSNIAHQWRQPLNTTGLIIQNIRDAYKYGELNKEYLYTNVDNAMKIVQNMSKTIDDFRNFFRTDKERQQFNLKECIGRALSLIYVSFKNSGITIGFEAAEDITIAGYPNEYLQVILNILSNARDALIEKKIENPQIKIRIFKENEMRVVTITDNAGGIPEDIIDRIFEPYFTTKEQGTGMGLYMSKTIIEKNMGGSLTVRNVDGGAEFRIEAPI